MPETQPTKPIIARFRMDWRIRFVDTDASELIHTSAFVRLLEETEYEFLRSRGLSVILSDEKGLMGFPRLSANVTMNKPLSFDELVTIELQLINVDGKMVEYEFVVTDNANATVGGGNFRVAVCRFPADAPPYAVLTPEYVIEALTSAPSTAPDATN
jgi:YbgC/YbaW family acyl-CoA thioester hydrolase